MEPTLRYDLVGGIAAVVLYPTSASLPAEPTVSVDETSEGYEVSLEVGQASYSEQLTPWSSTSGAMNYTVKHTLSFQGCHDDAPFGDEALKRALNEGVVADVKLSTGLVIRVGWSDRYGAEYPLRLVETSFDSGVKRLDYPLKSWVLESTDQSVLI